MTGSKEMFEQQRELELSDIPYRHLPVTKPAIAVQALKAVDNILESGNPLRVAETLSAVEEFISLVKKDKRLVDYVREELNKEKGKHTTVGGTKIESAEVGTKYDYSQCNDPILAETEKQSANLAEGLKTRQEFLKRLPAEGLEVLFGEELIRVFPPSKTSTSSYKVSLQNK
jgi:hypothetical protein